MVNRLILCLMLLCSFASNALTHLSASVDKNPVMLKESFILTITADANINPALLQTDGLQRHFQVVQSSTSSQTQIINSDIQHTTSWTILLMPKKVGQFQIPAFTIDNISSLPIDIEVIPVVATNNTGKAQEVFLETSVSSENIYLQSTIQYTTKLYLALEFQRGSLTEPKMENANISQISGKQDEESSEIRDGVRYRVITRVYSITPQRSGDYTITPPLFNGELVMNRQRSFFSGFNNTKPVSVVGNEIKITVLPIPDSYAGQWLPSAKVALNEEWQPENNNYKVGDPITRIITLTAVGVSEEQLPEIKVNYPVEVKTYPDQSTLHSTTRNNQLIAQRKDSIAIVPGQPGEITLPAVKIPWWNTITNAMEYATLPTKTITVAPATVATTNVAPVQASAPELPATLPLSQPTVEIQQVPVNSYLTWLFLTAWLLSLMGWILHVRAIKGAKPAATQTNSTKATSGKTYWSHFEKACKDNDPAKANSELLRWGRARWPEQRFNSTKDIAVFLDADELIDAINTLQQSLYSDIDGSWQGQTLLTVANKSKNPKTTASPQGLAPLNP